MARMSPKALSALRALARTCSEDVSGNSAPIPAPARRIPATAGAAARARSRNGSPAIGSAATAASAADDVLLHIDSDPSAQCGQNAGTTIGDISFLDASHIVEVHGGSSDPGIYTYSATPNATATERLAIPHRWEFYAVRYIGNGRIGFTAGPSSDQVSLYAMSASCTPATCDVAAGRGVTNLTGSQYVAVDYVGGSANFA